VRAMVDDVAAKLAFFVRGLFAFFNCENYGSSGWMKQDEGRTSRAPDPKTADS
jgi:hypothetical protein